MRGLAGHPQHRVGTLSVLEEGSPVAQAHLKLSKVQGMTLNSRHPCLCLPSSRIEGLNQHSWLYVVAMEGIWGLELSNDPMNGHTRTHS